MTPDNLDTLSDAELNECFAVEVAGWTSYDGRRLISPQPRRRIVIPPDFVFDANAVLPWLEKAGNPKIHWAYFGDPEWQVSLFPNGTEVVAIAPTFARAAAIALIRAKRAEAPAAQDISAEGTWWCNSHQREATHIDQIGRRCCDPDLAGILLPCSVVLAPMVVKPSRSKKGIK